MRRRKDSSRIRRGSRQRTGGKKEGNNSRSGRYNSKFGPKTTGRCLKVEYIHSPFSAKISTQNQRIIAPRNFDRDGRKKVGGFGNDNVTK
jgi:hypothetical protein